MTHNWKIVICGPPGTGKTALVRRYVSNQFGGEEVDRISGIDISKKEITLPSGTPARLQIWDLHFQKGKVSFRDSTLRYPLYRNAAGALLVFDLVQPDTYTVVDKWLAEIHELAPRGIPVILVGNKRDLIEGSGEGVDRSAARALAEGQGASYMETSAKVGTMVGESFKALVDRIRANAGP